VFALLLLLLLLLSPATALACRYSVRDVGFVDLETEPYRVCIFFRPELPTDVATLIEQMSAVALRDCNIQTEIVAAKAAENHPAFPRFPVGPDDPLAHAVLLSPEGQALPLALLPRDESSGDSQGPGPNLTWGPEPAGGARLRPSQGQSQGTTGRQQPRPTEPDGLSERLASVLGEVASSPKREELLAAVSRSFAAVLLIEGEAAEANRRARQAVSSAIEAIRGQMQSMPKTIAAPPALVVLEASALEPERILLWSLGLDTAPMAQPRAVIVYGRARWMGPLMQGEEITEPNVTGLLSIIGADCECGLDVAWTLGTRLPVRWGAARHAQVTKTLGFDPENPLVKIEVGRIAARSGVRRASSATDQGVRLSSAGSSTASDLSPTTPSPQPSPIGRERGLEGRGRGGVAVPSVGSPSATREESATNTAAFADSAQVLLRGWLFVAALAVIVLSTGGVLLWNAARRRSG
jgi:hypothetical protein